MQTPPGWYQDPSIAGTLRYWDGWQWTGQTAPVPAYGNPVYAQGPTFGSPDATREYQKAHAMAGWARFSVAFWGVAAIINLILLPGTIHSYVQVNNQLNAGLPVHQSVFVGISGYRLLVGLLAVAADIPFLVWQYRAARTSRQLRYPAALSPGLGVGGWFIPVCNFWFPYQSLRDCLPPGHPARGRILTCWLALWGNTICVIIATVAGESGGSGAAWAFGVLSALLVVTVSVLGWNLIGAMDHHQAQASGFS